MGSHVTCWQAAVAHKAATTPKTYCDHQRRPCGLVRTWPGLVIFLSTVVNHHCKTLHWQARTCSCDGNRVEHRSTQGQPLVHMTEADDFGGHYLHCYAEIV